MTAPAVYTAITNVTAALAREGIAKDRKNAQQGYSFRGIDDVYGALAKLLAEHKLCIFPRMSDRTVSERPNKSGGVLFYVVVTAQFDLVSALDGSTHSVVTYGEAMDSGDKATNKAMSAAYKYMVFMTFCVPTEGDNDTENASHEIKADLARPRTKPSPALPVSSATTGKQAAEDWAIEQIARYRSLHTIEDVDAFTASMADTPVKRERLEKWGAKHPELWGQIMAAREEAEQRAQDRAMEAGE